MMQTIAAKTIAYGIRRWTGVGLVFILAIAAIQARAANRPDEPIVFMIPGAASSGDEIYVQGLNLIAPIAGGKKYFGKFQDGLRKAGMQAEVCPATQDQDSRGLLEREEECVQQILRSRGEVGCGPGAHRNVILFGHSMGGLIARVLAQDERVKNCIDSVTTIATPHQGTPMADFAIAHENEKDLWGGLVRLVHFDTKHARYLPTMKMDRTDWPAETFLGQDIPPNPMVQYYSYSASQPKITMFPLNVLQGLISDELKKSGRDKTEWGVKNDGVVPEFSMIYGHYLGHINSHHFASACIDIVKNSKECKAVYGVVLPHLIELAHRAR